MQLAMIGKARGWTPAVRLGDGRYLDVAAATLAGLLDGAPPSSVIEILDARFGRRTALRRLVDAVEDQRAPAIDRLNSVGGLLDAADVSLGPPIRPALILCTGGAYREHMKEMGVEPPSMPSAFLKSPRALAGPGDTIVLPPSAPDMVDFECEFACVFDRPCHDVSPDEALSHVGGYTMINDVSARDAAPAWLESLRGENPRESCALWDRNVLHKQYPTFCPLGPVVTTRDAIGDPHDVHIRTLLNGTTMQSAHTADLHFALADLISCFSRWFRFAPGDVLTTGSPSGVGYARNPQRFLRPGDVVIVEGDGIGSLVNPVVAAPDAGGTARMATPTRPHAADARSENR